MTIPSKLIHDLRLMPPQGIIHVGANSGQEIPEYKKLKPQKAIYIEPIPDVFTQLKNNIGDTPNHYPLQALCSDIEGE